ncbi:XK-related protein 6-like [Neocloeon triangulifer]|uniref:XK-related protein 6-like n=1 Tax=Neocloeon triangulifer TaxID=2078957 RepID=UPI00286EB6B6|nr:XK-related protein 6-like [Neocloeon triangulifer]
MGSTVKEEASRLTAPCECKGRDETDTVPNHRYHVHTWELLILIFSISSYIIDILFDINLSRVFFGEGKVTYAVLTLMFVLVPSMITIALSVRWYMQDEAGEVTDKRSKGCWVLRFFVMMLQLAPVLRYTDSWHHGWKCRQAEKRKDFENQKRYYKLMLKEDADAALLRVFECFLEAAPQLVLQFTIIMIETKDLGLDKVISDLGLKDAPQALSIITSLISIAWSMASYQRSIRFATDHKQNISVAGSALQFTWHILIAVSRILSFSILASKYPIWTGVIVVCHCLVMTIWLTYWKPPPGCEGYTYAWTVAYSWILGLVYLFVYISTIQGRTRNFYLFYYSIFFFENLGMLTWYACSIYNETQPWYFTMVFVGASVSFFAGIIVMLVYYGWFHPTAEKSFDLPKESICRQRCHNSNSTLQINDLNETIDDDLEQIKLDNCVITFRNTDEDLTASACS